MQKNRDTKNRDTFYPAQIMQNTYHQTVLLRQAVDNLISDPDGIYVDLTFGGGGHSREILNRLSPKGQLLAFDQDAAAAQNTINDSRFQLLQYNFRHVQRSLRLAGIRQVAGILADLGVSSFQFDTPERGFSYRFDAFLDMRMNQQGAEQTAQTILNQKTAADLQLMFSNLGELRNAKTLAQAIVKARQRKPIETVQELLSVIEPNLIGNKYRYWGQVFQSLRMEANDEIAALQDMLAQTAAVIAPQGRLCVITFHSLEDKLVKNWVKNGCFNDTPEKDFYGNVNLPFQTVHKKPLEPSPAEIAANSRAHSAKLRVAARND